MPKVSFKPDDVDVEVSSGSSLFVATIEADVELESQCGGRGGCALCKVKVLEGEEGLSEMDWEERNHLGSVYHVTRERLACQTRVNEDVVIEILPPVERVKKVYVPKRLQRNAQQALLARLEAQESEVDSLRTVKGKSRRRRPAGDVSGELKQAPSDEEGRGRSRGGRRRNRKKPRTGEARSGPPPKKKAAPEGSAERSGRPKRRRRRRRKKPSGGGKGGGSGSTGGKAPGKA